MSQIISFSADKTFSDGLENLIEKSGYQNRSKFLRDAALYFAEIREHGEINNMNDDVVVEEDERGEGSTSDDGGEGSGGSSSGSSGSEPVRD